MRLLVQVDALAVFHEGAFRDFAVLPDELHAFRTGKQIAHAEGVADRRHGHVPVIETVAINKLQLVQVEIGGNIVFQLRKTVRKDLQRGFRDLFRFMNADGLQFYQGMVRRQIALDFVAEVADQEADGHVIAAVHGQFSSALVGRDPCLHLTESHQVVIQLLPVLRCRLRLRGIGVVRIAAGCLGLLDDVQVFALDAHVGRFGEDAQPFLALGIDDAHGQPLVLHVLHGLEGLVFQIDGRRAGVFLEFRERQLLDCGIVRLDRAEILGKIFLKLLRELRGGAVRGAGIPCSRKVQLTGLRCRHHGFGQVVRFLIGQQLRYAVRVFGGQGFHLLVQGDPGIDICFILFILCQLRVLLQLFPQGSEQFFSFGLAGKIQFFSRHLDILLRK